jgi:malonyl-ACP O-methyltransferase BioC
MQIDKEHVKRSFRKSISSYNENAIIQKNICKHLVELTNAYGKCSYENVLEIGCGTGLLTETLIDNFTVEHLILNDIVEEMSSEVDYLLRRKSFQDFKFISGDAEKCDFNNTFDLIISASTFQWFQDIDKAFNNMSKMLNKKGMFIFNTYASDNFYEIKRIKESGLEYRSFEEVERGLNKYFSVVHSEETKDVLYFNSVLDILKHLQLTGVNGTKAKKAWTKGVLKEFEENYKRLFHTDNGYSLTYNPAYFVCKVK